MNQLVNSREVKKAIIKKAKDNKLSLTRIFLLNNINIDKAYKWIRSRHGYVPFNDNQILQVLKSLDIDVKIILVINSDRDFDKEKFLSSKGVFIDRLKNEKMITKMEEFYQKLEMFDNGELDY